ncbi:MAG: TrkA family potassium uptake protein [Chloroflexi bacterium]|nr:TrkA family potassium uptake protein [Chloroflexota bacterium]
MFVLIVGGGKVGSHLASLLLAEGYRVKVIELRREHVDTLLKDLPAEVVVPGNGTDPEVLESAGIRQANVVAAVTGADETNLVASSLARFEFGVPRVIGRVNNPKNAWLYNPTMGVDVALSQADLMAHLIAEEMSLGDMMTLMKLMRGQYSLVQEKVHPASQAINQAIKALVLPDNCVLVAIIRKGQLLLPKGDTVLIEADEVLALVHSTEIAQFNQLLARPR